MQLQTMTQPLVCCTDDCKCALFDLYYYLNYSKNIFYSMFCNNNNYIRLVLTYYISGCGAVQLHFFYFFSESSEILLKSVCDFALVH